MTKGSKVFRPTDVPKSNSSSYPRAVPGAQRKRFNRRLGDQAGLKNYGRQPHSGLARRPVAARHAHSKQDDFVYVIEG